MRGRVVKQIALTTFRDFWRTPEAVFWTYGFPILMALALGLAFGSVKKDPIKVAVESAPGVVEQLKKSDRLTVVECEPGEGEKGFRRSKFAALVRKGEDGEPTLIVDPTRGEAELTRLLVERALATARSGGTWIEPLKVELEKTPGSRYIDWLIPGLIGLNLLGAGMWGIGFNLVQMRVRKTLRRLMVTPMTKFEFLFGFMLSRMVLTVPDALVIAGFGWLVFDVPIVGSWALIVLTLVIGSASFMGLGILVASRAQTTEGVSGLMNLVMLPMWLMGGTFFSGDNFPDAMQPAVKALPLTHMNDALRKVMLEDQGIAGIAMELGVLGGFCAVCFALAIRFFRWY